MSDEHRLVEVVLLTILALYVGTWIGIWWWAIELIVKQGNS